MDQSREKNVVLEREKNIERMRRRVKKAVANPIILEKYLVASSESDVNDYLNTMPLTDDAEIIYDQQKNVPGTVIINDSHDYPLLLQTVADELFKVTEINVPLTEMLKEDLIHEYQHHVPALGQPELKTFYGVRIFKNSSGGYSYQPFLTFRGRSPYYVYKDIVSSPSSLSDTDKQKLGKK